MQEEPNYQPQQNAPEQQAPLAPMQPAKPDKSNKKVVIITVVLIIITALLAVGATWYYMDNKQKDQQANNQKQVEQLKSQVSTLNNQDTQAKPSVTPSATPATTKNDVEVLKAFCQSLQPKSTIDPVIYYEGTGGMYGKCGTGGGQIVVAYVSSAWVKVYEGNGVFEDSLCTKYKIPFSIMNSCKGTY